MKKHKHQSLKNTFKRSSASGLSQNTIQLGAPSAEKNLNEKGNKIMSRPKRRILVAEYKPAEYDGVRNTVVEYLYEKTEKHSIAEDVSPDAYLPEDSLRPTGVRVFHSYPASLYADARAEKFSIVELKAYIANLQHILSEAEGNVNS